MVYSVKLKDGTKVWRATVRIKGHPPVTDRFSRKQEAEDWETETKLKIKQGKYVSNKAKEKL